MAHSTEEIMLRGLVSLLPRNVQDNIEAEVISLKERITSGGVQGAIALALVAVDIKGIFETPSFEADMERLLGGL